MSLKWKNDSWPGAIIGKKKTAGHAVLKGDQRAFNSTVISQGVSNSRLVFAMITGQRVRHRRILNVMFRLK